MLCSSEVGRGTWCKRDGTDRSLEAVSEWGGAVAGQRACLVELRPPLPFEAVP